jgi:ubiquinone/menaquinone biosynthesis C-methylase UbiE
MARLFTTGNADLNAFVMACLELQAEDRVLEIGFGPGNLMGRMADITTDGIVEGIDFSAAMFKQAAKTNIRHISSGRVVLHKGECGSLPFGNHAFDKLCSVNTIYFWQRPEDYFSEMFRVIKPGGKIVVGFRDYEQMANLNLSKEIFNAYTRNDVVDLLTEAGFQNAQIREKDGVPFISYCAVATRA